MIQNAERVELYKNLQKLQQELAWEKEQQQFYKLKTKEAINQIKREKRNIDNYRKKEDREREIKYHDLLKLKKEEETIKLELDLERENNKKNNLSYQTDKESEEFRISNRNKLINDLSSDFQTQKDSFKSQLKNLYWEIKISKSYLTEAQSELQRYIFLFE